MKTKSRFVFQTILLVVVFLMTLCVRSFAAFPPVLVIGGTPYSGTQGIDSNSNAYSAYTAGNSVLVLYGATGGAVNIGSNLTTALTSPRETGTWDGGMTVTLSGLTIIVPQVLVYYPGSRPPQGGSTMQGYDGETHQGDVGTAANGEAVVAFFGLPDGYIFEFSSVPPIYRYQAGTGPVTIDTTNGWPPANVFIFPSQITSGAETLNVTSYTSGLTNGYWANAYYAASNGSGVYGELHAYIAPDGSGGQLYGDVNGSSVNATWDSTTSCFVASPNLGVGFQSPSSGPAVGSVQYGPPQVEYNGVLLPFAFNDVNGSDFYWDPASGTWLTIDSSDSVMASDGSSYTYDPGSQMFSGSANLAAIGADGISFLGYDSGAAVEAYNLSHVDDGLICYLGQIAANATYSLNITYSFTQSNGLYAEYVVNPVWLISTPFAFVSGNVESPIYTTNGGSVSFNAANGWPAGGLPSLPSPNRIYLDGQEYDLSSTEDDGVWESCVYTTPSGSDSITFQLSYSGCEYGTGYDGNGYVMSRSDGGNGDAYPGDMSFSYSVLSTGAGYSDDGTVYFSSSASGSPSYGPSQIFWNGNEYDFVVTRSGADTYINTPTGAQITINSSHHVTASGASGTYDTSTLQFDISGMLAQDGNGNLLGVSPGLVCIFAGSSSWPGGAFDGQGGATIEFEDGSGVGSTYNVERNDGSWFTEYLGLTNGSLFIVQDSSGNFSSPLYRYCPSSGNDVIVDTTSSGNWPASTNLYPATLYINGHLATLDSDTASNNGINGGSATYLVQPNTGDSFTINWTWNNSFSASVSGSYLGTTWSSGTWDGHLFGSLPTGVVISTQTPVSSARYGPSQILWDGVQLFFNGAASTPTAGNPTGADVYEDSLGLGMQVTIASDDTVTASQLDGSVSSGTYNPSSQQFQFSDSSVGSVQAANSQGFVYSSNGTTPPTLSQDTKEVSGNLDVHGDTLTLGNWTDNSGNSDEAFALVFSPAQNGGPNTFNFASTLQSTEWIWSQSAADGGAMQSTAMVLTPGHALQIYSSENQSTPAITLDPGGNGTPPTITVSAPSGDIPMYQGD